MSRAAFTDAWHSCCPHARDISYRLVKKDRLKEVSTIIDYATKSADVVDKLKPRWLVLLKQPENFIKVRHELVGVATYFGPLVRGHKPWSAVLESLSTRPRVG
jgi:hypothetical protein